MENLKTKQELVELFTQVMTDNHNGPNLLGNPELFSAGLEIAILAIKQNDIGFMNVALDSITRSYSII